MKDIKNVLLLGGTGPMGIHLSKILASESFKVYVTSRKKHNSHDNIVYLEGNARENEFIHKVLGMREWDCIVDFMVYSTEEFRKRVGLLLSHTKQYLFLSSSRIYVGDQIPITEETNTLLEKSDDKVYLGTDEYALYKAREEKILKDSKCTNYTIVRPYITFAENRLPLGVLEKETWMQRVLQGKDIVIPQDVLEKYTTLAYGKDVSFAISKLIDNADSLGQAYNVVSNKAIKWKDVLSVYLDAVYEYTGKRPKVFTIGRPCYSYKRMLHNWLRDILSFGRYKFQRGDYSLNYQLEYDRMFDRVFDNSKIKNIAPPRLNEDIRLLLKQCAKTFMSNPDYSYINWPMEFVHDRLSQNKTSLRVIPSIKYKLLYILIRYIIPIKYITIK